MPDPDLERFDALYEEHFPRVWAYVVSRLGRQAAEEVVSDTFAVAWRRRREIPAEALPWLLGVARNVARGALRSGARRDQLAAELRALSAVEAAAEPDVADAVVERAAVLRALATLSEADREVLTLVAWHDLPARDAAAVLGCSRAAFAVRLHRARRRLERAVGRAGEDPAPALERRSASLVTGKEFGR